MYSAFTDCYDSNFPAYFYIPTSYCVMEESTIYTTSLKFVVIFIHFYRPRYFGFKVLSEILWKFLASKLCFARFFVFFFTSKLAFHHSFVP